MKCCCCGRQVVSYRASDNTIIGPGFTKMVNGVCCKECSADLDENGLFPEERAQVYSLEENNGEDPETEHPSPFTGDTGS